MAWTAPRTWVTSEVVTAALMNSAVRDNLRYLKGLDGAITIEDDIVTAHNVDGVDVSSHEGRHVSGGADDIDSALAIAAMPNLADGNVWKGNVSNRPAEVAFPTRTLSAANETVQEGYYAGTTLSAVDADLAAANIKSGTTIFGFLGTFVNTLAEDIVGSSGPIDTSDTTTAASVLQPSIAGSGDYACATKTQSYDASSLAVAVGFVNAVATTVSTLKLRLYMDGVQVAESSYFAASATAETIILVATRALSGSKICKIDIHNYSGTVKTVTIPSAQDSNGQALATGIGIGSVKTT